ncbi:MAG: DNA helicase UvrD [Candidatus Aenigmarchaeota archaeon]|nr:DNA helicase UvrD [Candidatus Aenigmarchaeota archaeon]
MKIIADFQLHSKYSRATSKDMDIEHLSKGAKIKGLNLLGTGDFTHPLWLKELKEKLQPINDSGIFTYSEVFFLLTGEISTFFEHNGKIKKIHHVIHCSGFDIVEQMNDILSKYGDLKADGRPIVNVTPEEIVEQLVDIDKNIFIYPSHAWTPFFGCFGSKSGLDSVDECYGDQIKHIHAIETGLSSDPSMNWRVSSLDRFTLLSSSDSHSPNPWRLGREANIFDLDAVSYNEIHDTIIEKDKNKFLYTIETDPSYGKYHFTGHRNCQTSFHPKDAMELNNICPRCKRKLTIGVMQRVEELADRPEGFVPRDAIPFKTLLPLYEIISFVTGTKQLYSKKVMEEQNKLINTFGNELKILLETSKEDLVKVTKPQIADAIVNVREGKIKYIPGYDGVYGEPVFDNSLYENFRQKHNKMTSSTQKNLREFKGL